MQSHLYTHVFRSFADVNEAPVNLCLLNAKTVISEKSRLISSIGQIALEDPDHPKSMGICQTSTKILSPQYLSYTCDIWSSSDNVDDIKMKFYIDQHFVLNRKGDLSYKARQSYVIPIMCRDVTKPIHLIERSFTVSVKGRSVYLHNDFYVIE